MWLSPFPITSDWVTPVGSISPAAPLMSADVAALAHSLCSIPNTKHSHRPVFPHHLWRNPNQHLSKHAPHFLPTALLYAYICAHTLVHYSFQLSWITDNITCFQDQALPQVHCGASPKSLPWFLCKAWKSSHTERKLLLRPAPPASSSPRARKDNRLFPSLRVAQWCFLEISWVFSAKAQLAARPGELAAAHHWHSWNSHMPRLTAPKYSCSHPPGWHKIHPLVLSDARKRVVLARPGTGILSLLALPFASAATYSLAFPHPIKVLLL